MLQKPDLPDARITTRLRDEYGLRVSALAFLALGADSGTAVYRATADDDTVYFLKLRRRGAFAPSTVDIPHVLHDRGIAPVIAPMTTTTGRSWTSLESFAAILFPFVEGRDGFEQPLSDLQWVELGAAVQRMHAVVVPPELSRDIPHETYSPRWRERVRQLQTWARQSATTDHTAAQLMDFLRWRQKSITDLVERAERLASGLRERRLPCVLCHADLHAFNVLIAADGTLYIVDWDTAMFAPRERDLMFIGGGVGGVWKEDREVELFYTGYGTVGVDQTALAYYRHERIVEDIAAYSDEYLADSADDAARAKALAMLESQFGPDSVVDIAYRSYPLHNLSAP